MSRNWLSASGHAFAHNDWGLQHESGEIRCPESFQAGPEFLRAAAVTNGAKVIHIRRLKSDPGVNLLS
ncbi:hypothetical protein AIG44_23500 [Salmonella enterica subsp. enterica serovar Bredeney]|nr:hypothetical protein [Salmonella enterica subsp. enterica serovar Bredeney]